MEQIDGILVEVLPIVIIAQVSLQGGVAAHHPDLARLDSLVEHPRDRRPTEITPHLQSPPGGQCSGPFASRAAHGGKARELPQKISDASLARPVCFRGIGIGTMSWARRRNHGKTTVMG